MQLTSLLFEIIEPVINYVSCLLNNHISSLLLLKMSTLTRLIIFDEYLQQCVYLIYYKTCIKRYLKVE